LIRIKVLLALFTPTQWNFAKPRTAWMQELSRREEELYQMANAAEIAERNARMRVNRIPESATFPPEQERLYGYDAEAVLRN
jgi:salicylate hydroxylase